MLSPELSNSSFEELQLKSYNTQGGWGSMVAPLHPLCDLRRLIVKVPDAVTRCAKERRALSHGEVGTHDGRAC